MTLKTHVVESPESVDRSEWQALCERSDHTVFQLPGWQLGWWRAFAGDRRWQAVAAYDEDRLVMLLPLFVEAGVLRLIGQGHSDYLDAIVDREFEAQSARWLAQSLAGRNVDLHGVRPGGHLDRWCSAQARRDPRVVEYDRIVALSLALDEEQVEDLLQRRSTRKRKDRGLAKAGMVSVEHLRDTESVALALPILYDQHERRWRGHPTANFFRQSRVQQFYEEVVTRLGPLGALQLSLLRVDEQPVAAALAFRWNGVLLWYKPTHDVEFSQWSPGERLLIEMIRDARAAGLVMVDLARGDSPFKRRFTRERPAQWVRNYRLYANPLTGSWYRARNIARLIYRRFVPDPDLPVG